MPLTGCAKLDPEGNVLTTALLEDIGDPVSPRAWVATKNGGGRLVANLVARSDAGMTSGDLAAFEPATARASSICWPEGADKPMPCGWSGSLFPDQSSYLLTPGTTLS